MARVLAVDDDTLARAVLVDLLAGLGHEAIGVASAVEALQQLAAGPFDAVVSDVLMPGVDGFTLAARVAERGGPPVVLASGFYRGDAEGQAAKMGVRIAGFLAKPVRPEQLGPLLDRLLAAPAAPAGAGPTDPGWSGLEFLHALDGTLELAPPVRALFLAHRVGASGTLDIATGEVRATIALRAGRIVQVEGIPGLLRALDPRLPDHRSLGKDVAAAVAAGHDVQRALDAGADGLGDFLAKLAHARGGRVRFDARAVAPGDAGALATPVPRVIAGGLRRARTPAQLDRAWLALSQATATAVSPSDSDESQWGLDPIALLIVKLATAPIAVGALIQRASGGDSAHRAECLVAIDLVYWLGLLAVDGGVLSSSGDTGGRGLRSRGSATEEDPRLSRLRQALAAMEGQNPVDVLGLGDRALIDAEEVARAYREQSRTYHPDHYQGAPPLLRALAEACFARLNAAQEALAIPGGLAEAQSLLAARAEGRPFVTARDGQRARVAFRRGETLFHNRDWRGADAQFQEAVAKDPSAWPHALYAARAGYLSKRLSAAHAVDALDGLVVEDARRRAEVQVAVGNILKLEGRVGEALRRFHAALDLDAENRDAQREIRPARSREGEGGADPSGSALISNLLKRRES